MPVLANARHERFAQELAKGETADAAYVSAGYKANRGNAATLKAKQNVIARVTEIQERAAVRTEITIAALNDRLIRLADAAEKIGDASGIQASRACIADIAKINGMIVEKVETGKPGDFERMTDDELARFVAREIADLGIGPAGAAAASGKGGVRSEPKRVH